MSILGNNLFAQYYAQQGLPYGYRKVEYLESTGKQKIIPNIQGDMSIVGDAQMTATKNESQIIFCSTAHGVGGSFFGYTQNSTDYCWGFGAISQNGLSSISILTKIHFALNFNSEGATGTVGSEQIARSATITQGKWSLFASTNNLFFANAKLWNCRFLQQNQIIRNFIPCVRKSDSKPGLYDLCGSICPLTNTPFYVNAGTGEFVTP